MAPPVNPVPAGIPQLYVVPTGTIVVGGALTGVTEKGSPLQIVAGWVGMRGTGLIVTVIVRGFPMQFPEAPDVGVTV